MRRTETVTTCDVCGAEDRRHDAYTGGPKWHCVEVMHWAKPAFNKPVVVMQHVCEVCMVKVREALGVSDEG